VRGRRCEHHAPRHRFKQIVGITPKRLARTYRFAKVVLSVDAAAAVDWGDLAFRAGYFDQSHFVKDFRTFTGCTPTAYLALRRRFLADHPGNALDIGPLPPVDFLQAPVPHPPQNRHFTTRGDSVSKVIMGCAAVSIDGFIANEGASV
jgi:helix-turn-helix protein